MGVSTDLEKGVRVSRSGKNIARGEQGERKFRENIRESLERRIGTKRQFDKDWLQSGRQGEQIGTERQYAGGKKGKRQRTREERLRGLAGAKFKFKGGLDDLGEIGQMKRDFETGKKEAQAKLDRLVANTSVPVFRETADTRARALLGSVEGQLVGENLREAKELTTRRGEREFKEKISGGAMEQLETGRITARRALSAAQRTSEAQMQQLGMRRAGGSAAGLGAIRTRSGERIGTVAANIEMQAATERASVAQQAENFFLTTARGWRDNAVLHAQNWMDNVSGIRDQFNADMMGYGQMVQGAYQNLSSSFFESAKMEMQHQQIKAQAAASMVGAVGSVLGGAGSMMCYAAAVYYPVGSTEWKDCRLWFQSGWPRASALGRLWLPFYAKHGARVATALRRSFVLRRLVRPFFTWAAKRGGEMR